MHRTIARQGDVIIIATGSPKESEIELAPKDARGLVLAEGETSGHHHAVFGNGAKLFHFKDSQRTDRILSIAEGGADVRVVGGGSGGVDRHTPISLKPGHYTVRVQRAWDSTHVRQVQD
jgi:hypothetical protein